MRPRDKEALISELLKTAIQTTRELAALALESSDYDHVGIAAAETLDKLHLAGSLLDP